MSHQIDLWHQPARRMCRHKRGQLWNLGADRVKGECDANCRFGKCNFLRQFFDLCRVWKTVSAYKLVNHDEGRVASVMGFKKAARTIHLRGHTTIGS